ncbi:MAG: hypothetical protein HC806_04085 [Anaerolineae bacterium]|nr:hypothetical protein [Anaerolineae bacterium]
MPSFCIPSPTAPPRGSGIQNGDRLVSADELFITSETSMEAVEAALRGLVGTKLEITILRFPQEETLSFTIQREEVGLPSVIWHKVEGEESVGIIQVTLLAEPTPEEIIKAVELLQDDGAEYFILDLRGNGGGLLNAGLETAKLFLDDGEIIYQQYRGKEVESFSVTRPGPLSKIPLAVLVNKNTASAAEIVAGALLVNKRGKLIGEPTFGKDTIQLVFELQDASSLHITSANWWFPELEFPGDGFGLMPTFIVTSDQNWVQIAVDILLSP